MEKQFILFDLDGTITDSAEGIINCVKYALNKLGVEPPDRKTLNKFIGPPLKYSFSEYCGLDEASANFAVSAYRERYRDIGIFECSAYEGIEHTLKVISESGKTLVLATAKPEIFAKRIIEHFNLKCYFKGIVGAEIGGKLNYKDEIIAEVLNRFNITDKSRVIMVGDREQDIKGAKQNGIESIGVKYGFAEQDELERAGADYIAETPYDILKMLI